MSDMPETLYLDDLTVGQRFEAGPIKVTAAEIVAYARSFDPQPFHLDEDAAKATFFGGLAASGWHTASLTMRMVVAALPLGWGVIGGGGEISWPNATRPGDTLRVECEVVEVTPSRSRPDRGMATVRTTTLNQDGKPVQVLVAKLVVPRRQANG